MPLVAAKCTQCGANIEIDDSQEAGICKYCGTAFITEKAINNYKINAEKVIVNSENVNISNYDIESALVAVEKLIKGKLFDDAKKMIKEIIENCPYDYRGWWQMALLEYNQDGCWFDENKNYKKALALADDPDIIKDFRNKEYDRIWEEGKAIVEFCDNPDINMLDKIYIPVLATYYDDVGLCTKYMGLEIINNQLNQVRYVGLDNMIKYGRYNYGQVTLKAEVCSDYYGSRVLGVFYDRENKKIEEGFANLCISDIVDGKIILDHSEKMIRGEKLSNLIYKSGCYLATCVYGSYDCPQVWTLRRFRDYTLDKTWYGRVFIKCYYAISPTLVKWFGKTNWFKSFWKSKLDRMVADLNRQGIDDTYYCDKY